MKKLFMSFLALVMLSSCISVHAETGTAPASQETDESQEATRILKVIGMDITLDDECDNYTAVTTYLHNSIQINSAVETIQNVTLRQSILQHLEDNYLPSGAWCTDAGHYEDSDYIDYQKDGIRYIDVYYPSGTVARWARALFDHNDWGFYVDSVSTDIVAENDNARAKETDQIEKWHIDKRDMQRNEDTPTISISQEVIPVSATLAYTNVDPAPVEESYPQYYASLKHSGFATLPCLSGSGYSTSQSYHLYETMGYYNPHKTNLTYLIGESLYSIANAFTVSLTTLRGWLTVVSTIYNSVLSLQHNIRMAKEQSCDFSGGRECGIMEPITTHTYVEPYEVWDSGRLVLVWQYNSTTGYKNPLWGISIQSDAFNTPWTTVLSEGMYGYETNFERYGYWMHGPGLFGQ